MKLKNLDLNLLKVFDAIYKTKSVTVASEEVGLTQSSVSNALNRLRDYFKDPLFVRVNGQMEPTPFAQKLSGPVQLALGQLSQAIENTRVFDPDTSKRSFSICTSEVGQRVFLPKLLKHLSQVAPLVSLSIVDIDANKIDDSLVNGGIDLAVGFFEEFGQNFHMQHLFAEEYVVMVRQNHSVVRKELSLDSYMQGAHIVYLPSSASHSSLENRLDREFAKRGVPRNVGLRVAHSMGLSSIVANTDLMVTLPSRLAETFRHSENIQIYEVPFPLGKIEICQHWHARFHHDQANQWLRAQIKFLFQQN
jgi:DNA-binding transcriptional LysR family regulator